MFQFAHGPRAPLYIQGAVSRHHSGRVAPFGFSRLIARMQLPLNVSPVSASFFGLAHRGIHLVLSLACGILCVHTVLPARRRVDVCLPLFLLLFALGKIEEIILYSLIFCSLVQGTMLSREVSSSNNWNVESHRLANKLARFLSPQIDSLSHKRKIDLG